MAMDCHCLLPDPGVEPTSPVSPALQEGSVPLSHPESPCTFYYWIINSNQQAFQGTLYKSISQLVFGSGVPNLSWVLMLTHEISIV